MGIRNLKPTTPGSRFASRSDFSEITKSFPEKSLTVALRKTGGRNNNGRITVRHRGGGHRRRYRIIDFKRDKFDIPAKIVSIEYDPNRSANIALLFYEDGEKRYILSPFGAKVGDQIVVNSQTRTITAIASDTSLTVNAVIASGSTDASPEIHPASFVVLNDSGVIDMLIDTDGNIEGAGGIGMATTGKAIAMAVVFGG